MENEIEIARRNFLSHFDSVGKEMAKVLKSYLIYGYKKNLSYVYRYLRSIDPVSADYVLDFFSGDLKKDLEENTPFLDTIEPEVQNEAAHVLNSSGFNSPEILDKIDSLFPARFNFHELQDELYKKNPLLVDLIKYEDEFNYRISKMNSRDLQKVLREVENKTIVKAFSNSPDDIKAKLKESVSKNNWKTIKEDWSLNRFTESEIIDCQEKILFVIRCLSNSYKISATVEDLQIGELYGIF